MKIAFVILLLFSAALSGCLYDNYKELYPAASLTSTCDTLSAVTYSTNSKQISSILNSYCVSCHSSSVTNGNVELDTYSGAMNAAQNGQLLGSLLGQSPNTQMPPNTKLDACSIREVQLWIQNNYAQ